MPIRIYALAKEIGFDNKQVLDVCYQVGIKGKGSALASLDDDEVAKIKSYLTNEAKRRISEAYSAAAPKLILNGLYSYTSAKFPSEILSGLLHLDLSFNQLGSSKKIHFENFPDLERLELRSCGLGTLPSSIQTLSKLKILDVSDNCLTSFPSWIGDLPNLRVLYANNNRLSVLPSEFGSLTKLEELDLSENILADVSRTPDLTALVTLCLDGNKIKNGISGNVENWANLEKLLVRNCGLQKLPKSLGQLAQLQLLDVRDNHLTGLPASAKNLTALSVILLNRNSQLAIPPEILRNSTIGESVSGQDELWIGKSHGKRTFESPEQNGQEVLSYYFELLKGRERLGEAKVLLLGQGSVGKTSIVNRILSSRFNDDEKQTEGINISKWSTKIRTSKHSWKAKVMPTKLNIWDFGGQEIMHATHQFFLTKRSLYLLVLDARAGEQQGNLHYWLRTVQSYGGDSPIVVVVNKCEPPHHLELDERRLKLDYAPNVMEFCYVSCKTGSGFKKLKQTIQKGIRKLRHIDDKLPVSYFDVKNELERKAKEKDFIDIGEFRQICVDNGIDSIASQRQLIHFLHDLGVVLHFDDPNQVFDVHDTKVLNPTWVTGGVYKVLNDPDLLRKSDGKLDVSKIGDVIGERKRYPKSRHRFLIDLMRKFDLCFEFNKEQQLLLVPELLSVKEPDVGWSKNKEVLNFQYHYAILPRGLIPRFIVRTNHLLTSTPTYWRNGVVLEVENCRVLVRGDLRQGIVFIQVEGNRRSRRAALAIVRDHFQAIHSAIPSLDAKPQVLLPEEPNAPPIDYSYLIRLEQSGVDAHIFPGAEREYTIRELLDGVDQNDFDVFLAHNSEDKPAVRELAKHLRNAGLRSWIDEQDLVPGAITARELVQAIECCHSVAVLIGPRGIGPWQNEELLLAISEAVRGGKPLIPIFLPNSSPTKAGYPPELKILKSRTAANFQSGFKQSELEKLQRALRCL